MNKKDPPGWEDPFCCQVENFDNFRLFPAMQHRAVRLLRRPFPIGDASPGEGASSIYPAHPEKWYNLLHHFDKWLFPCYNQIQNTVKGKSQYG